MRHVWLTVCVFAAACNCDPRPIGTGGGGGTGGGAATGGGGGSAMGGGGGGGAGGAGGAGCLPGVLSIAITPAGSTVALGTPPAAVSFTATATTATGMQNVTSQVQWSATRDDDTPPGKFTAPGSYLP